MRQINKSLPIIFLASASIATDDKSAIDNQVSLIGILPSPMTVGTSGGNVDYNLIAEPEDSSTNLLSSTMGGAIPAEPGAKIHDILTSNIHPPRGKGIKISKASIEKLLLEDLHLSSNQTIMGKIANVGQGRLTTKIDRFLITLIGDASTLASSYISDLMEYYLVGVDSGGGEKVRKLYTIRCTDPAAAPDLREKSLIISSTIDTSPLHLPDQPLFPSRPPIPSRTPSSPAISPLEPRPIVHEDVSKTSSPKRDKLSKTKIKSSPDLKPLSPEASKSSTSQTPESPKSSKFGIFGKFLSKGALKDRENVASPEASPSRQRASSESHVVKEKKDAIRRQKSAEVLTSGTGSSISPRLGSSRSAIQRSTSQDSLIKELKARQSKGTSEKSD